jgi:2-dehydro-3-deoxyglucarate aldolase
MQNKVKKYLKNGDLAIGSWITLAHTAIAEIMANAGFEWITIDMEHSVIGISDIQPLIQVIELSGCVPLVRLSSNDPVLTKRVMDAGAYGVIVPMVNTPEDAELAVSSVKYPPWGSRSVGLARAQGYGPRFEEYAEKVNDWSIVIVQIEHRKGVENIDEILAVEGIDGLIIGPYDFSGSYKIPGKLDHPLMRAAEHTIIEAAKKFDIPAGIHIVHPSVEDFKR